MDITLADVWIYAFIFFGRIELITAFWVFTNVLFIIFSGRFSFLWWLGWVNLIIVTPHLIVKIFF